MKTKLIYLSTLLCFGLNNAWSQDDFAFKVGEKLEYDVYYNWGVIWVNAAKTIFTVEDATFKQMPAFRLEMATRTVKAFGLLNFNDTTTTFVNKRTLYPYFARQASHEPDYFSIIKTTFFRNDSVRWGVHIEKERKKGISFDTITAEKAYFDILTTLYRLRNIDHSQLVENHKIPMPMLIGDEIYDLYVRIAGRETIKLKNGKSYNCIKVKPLLAEGKLFSRGEGMTIWISDDQNRIPLMIESKLKIGSMKAMVNKIENNKHPITSEIKKK